MNKLEISQVIRRFVRPCSAGSIRRSVYADEAGATLVEYLIMVGLVGIAALIGFELFGTAVTSSASSLTEFVREVFLSTADAE